MPSIRIPKDAPSGIYFLTFSVKNHYYVFDRHGRFEILAESLKFCQKNFGLKLFAYVFMLNHMHLIASAPDMIKFVRDFKRFISREMEKNILSTEPDVLKLFNGCGRFEFWAKTNMPKVIEKDEYLLQKTNYIYNNPVRKQYVKRPEDWYWSSANPESPLTIEPLP